MPDRESLRRTRDRFVGGVRGATARMREGAQAGLRRATGGAQRPRGPVPERDQMRMDREARERMNRNRSGGVGDRHSREAQRALDEQREFRGRGRSQGTPNRGAPGSPGSAEARSGGGTSAPRGGGGRGVLRTLGRWGNRLTGPGLLLHSEDLSDEASFTEEEAAQLEGGGRFRDARPDDREQIEAESPIRRAVPGDQPQVREQVEAPGGGGRVTPVEQRTGDRTTLRRTGPGGGTGELTFDPEARRRTQEQLGTLGEDGEPTSGTVSTMPAGAVASLPPSQREGLRQARRAAADRGDWDAVDRSFMDPETRQREDRRTQLRRDAQRTQGLDQTLSGMMREGLRRRGAREQLRTMAAQDEAQADRQMEQQQQGFENQLALRQQQVEEQRLGRELGQEEQDRLWESTERVRDTIDRTVEVPDGASEAEQRRALNQRDFIERFMEREDAEMSPAEVRRGQDIYESLTSLDELAEETSDPSILGGTATGALLGTLGGAALAVATRGRAGTGAATGGVAGGIGGGLANFFRSGEDMPTFETPEEAVGELQAMREAGVGDALEEGGTVEWRGQRINVDGWFTEDLSPEMRQRLRRLLDLVPDRE